MSDTLQHLRFDLDARVTVLTYFRDGGFGQETAVGRFHDLKSFRQRQAHLDILNSGRARIVHGDNIRHHIPGLRLGATCLQIDSQYRLSVDGVSASVVRSRARLRSRARASL